MISNLKKQLDVTENSNKITNAIKSNLNFKFKTY